jgi:hypothetical protein
MAWRPRRAWVLGAPHQVLRAPGGPRREAMANLTRQPELITVATASSECTGSTARDTMSSAPGVAAEMGPRHYSLTIHAH